MPVMGGTISTHSGPGGSCCKASCVRWGPSPTPGCLDSTSQGPLQTKTCDENGVSEGFSAGLGQSRNSSFGYLEK